VFESSSEFSGKKPRTKAPKIQRLVTPRVLQHKRRRIALKKQRTKKNKEEAAEYAKLLAKRMKVSQEDWGWEIRPDFGFLSQTIYNCFFVLFRRPKKNARNRLPRDGGCPLRELLPPSLSLVKKDFLRVTNQ